MTHPSFPKTWRIIPQNWGILGNFPQKYCIYLIINWRIFREFSIQFGECFANVPSPPLRYFVTVEVGRVATALRGQAGDASSTDTPSGQAHGPTAGGDLLGVRCG